MMIETMKPPGLKPTTHWAMAAQMPAMTNKIDSWSRSTGSSL